MTHTVGSVMLTHPTCLNRHSSTLCTTCALNLKVSCLLHANIFQIYGIVHRYGQGSSGFLVQHGFTDMYGYRERETQRNGDLLTQSRLSWGCFGVTFASVPLQLQVIITPKRWALACCRLAGTSVPERQLCPKPTVS